MPGVIVGRKRGYAMQTGFTREDALAYLPCSTIAGYCRGEVIYDRSEPQSLLYLVIDGKVKVSRVADNGHQVIIDIFQADEFFGESALLGRPRGTEQAMALEDIKVMTWAASEIENLIVKQPRLGLALVQIAAERVRDSVYRIDSFSSENISRRLARSLLRFAERLGSPEPDGAIRTGPFTHELLSQYIGTSREIVTHWMARFQREGYLKYSRSSMLLYSDRFQRWLRASRDRDRLTGANADGRAVSVTPGPPEAQAG